MDYCGNCGQAYHGELCVVEVEITTCDACGGDFSVETEQVICETDSQIADHEYEEGPYSNATCEIDGWKKFEHDLGRDLVVHGSCFLNHDDVLVRI